MPTAEKRWWHYDFARGWSIVGTSVAWLTMGLAALCILGLVAGGIAKALLPGRDPGGLIVTMAIGVAGAFAGGFIARQVWGFGLQSFFNLHTWMCAIGGSMLLLLLYRVVHTQLRRSRQ
jgi:uncharacterized membrane protein YeaQ/YmgE (transglycosylase-associated protein family)